MRPSLGLFIFFLSFLSGCQFFPSALKEDQVCFKDRCIQVEVAQKKEDMARGLMFRTSLAAERGMLFVFPEEGVYSFWMKNTLIPLDMIWLNKSQQIVDIKENIPPCRQDPCPSYRPAQKALYVLEINAFGAGQLQIRPGDQARFVLRGDEPVKRN